MSKQWTIAIGSDNAGTEYKSTLKADLEKDSRVKSVIDVGVNRGEEDFDTAYPHIGVKAARLVAEGKADRALLICGTGMGVAISANKVVRWVWVCVRAARSNADGVREEDGADGRRASGPQRHSTCTPRPVCVARSHADSSDSFSVERLVKSNNAQVLCLGQRVIGLELARKLVTEWLGHHFDESSASAEKVEVLNSYDKAKGSAEHIERVPGGCN